MPCRIGQGHPAAVTISAEDNSVGVDMKSLENVAVMQILISGLDVRQRVCYAEETFAVVSSAVVESEDIDAADGEFLTEPQHILLVARESVQEKERNTAAAGLSLKKLALHGVGLACGSNFDRNLVGCLSKQTWEKDTRQDQATFRFQQ